MCHRLAQSRSGKTCGKVLGGEKLLLGTCSGTLSSGTLKATKLLLSFFGAVGLRVSREEGLGAFCWRHSVLVRSRETTSYDVKICTMCVISWGIQSANLRVTPDRFLSHGYVHACLDHHAPSMT